MHDDAELDAEVRDAGLEALAEIVGQLQGDAAVQTARTFLTSISAVGFRGIGPQARLYLYPAPGADGRQRRQRVRQIEFRRGPGTRPNRLELSMASKGGAMDGILAQPAPGQSLRRAPTSSLPEFSTHARPRVSRAPIGGALDPAPSRRSSQQWASG